MDKNSLSSSQFYPICERLAFLINHDSKLFNLKDPYQQFVDYGRDYEAFMDSLTDKAHHVNMSLLKNKIPLNKLKEYLIDSQYPVFTFVRNLNNDIQAIIFDYESSSKSIKAYLYQNDQEIELENPLDYLDAVLVDENGQISLFLAISTNPILSDYEGNGEKKPGPVKRLFNLLNAEKKDIAYIYFYAILTSLIGLVLPVGVQAVMELISGGVVFNSIILMIGLVIVATIAAGVLQIMQYNLVEVLQRRIFVKASFEFSFRIPKMKTEDVLHTYPPELVNRFFDVLTIQKSLPKILIDISAAALQILFGLLLLSFYHPIFIAFSFVLIIVLTALFYVTGPKGLDTSLTVSKYKYKVAHWLEEIARTMYSFKLAGHTNLAIEKTDGYINNYLHYRKKHYKVLINQFASMVVFKTMVTGGLLIIGSFLVIQREITLGQFVATEIVIVLVIAAVEKLIQSVSTVYDMLTAVEKVGHVTDIPFEKKEGVSIIKSDHTGMDIKTSNLSFIYPESNIKALNDVSFEIKYGESVCISGYNNSGKNTLARVIVGLLEDYKGVVTLNNISLKDINLNSLRDNVAKNVSTEDIFDGTLFQNVSMGKSNVKYEDVIWALENVGLMDFVNSLPKGLQTELVAAGRTFSDSTIALILLARCIAERPRLLVLNDVFQLIEPDLRKKILLFLMDKSNPWTLIFISNDPFLMFLVDKILLMEKGKLIGYDTFDNLKSDGKLRKLLLNDFND